MRRWTVFAKTMTKIEPENPDSPIEVDVLNRSFASEEEADIFCDDVLLRGWTMAKAWEKVGGVDACDAVKDGDKTRHIEKYSVDI